MHFETYDSITGDVINQISIIDFGDLIQGQHCSRPIVLRAITDTETSISNLKIFLENKGLWKDSSFGYFKSPIFVSSVESGDSRFNPLTEVPGATPISSGGISFPTFSGPSDYLWLDVQVVQTGSTEANFRVFFDSP